MTDDLDGTDIPDADLGIDEPVGATPQPGRLRDNARLWNIVHLAFSRHAFTQHGDRPLFSKRKEFADELLNELEAAIARLLPTQEAPADPVAAVKSIDCPLPSCGAKAGEACNRDLDKGRMGVHRVTQPSAHLARIRTAIASPVPGDKILAPNPATPQTASPAADEKKPNCGHAPLRPGANVCGVDRCRNCGFPERESL